MKLLTLIIASLIATQILAGPQITAEGLIEVEASHTDQLLTPSAELATIITANSNWSGQINLIHQEADDLTIDEVTLKYQKDNVEIRIGQMVLPFLQLESNFISDPQTLELTETNTQALSGKLEWQKLSLETTLFRASYLNRNIDSVILGTNYKWSHWVFGAGYISNLTGSGFFTERSLEISNSAPAVSFFIKTSSAKYKLILEYVTALRELKGINYNNNDFNILPSSIQIELSYNLKTIILIIGIQATKDGPKLPKNRLLAAVQLPFNKNTTISLEYAGDELNQEHRDHTLTGQLALIF